MKSEELYSPYCKICEACGEEGCCSAMCCQQHSEGDYCKSYLADLKFGYLMYKEMMKIVGDDPKYKQEIEAVFNRTYNAIYVEYIEKSNTEDETH
jgi:hypothetical protein